MSQIRLENSLVTHKDIAKTIREYQIEIETCERSMDSDMKPYYKIRNRKSGNTRYPQATKDDSIHHGITDISEKEFKQIQANKYNPTHLMAHDYPHNLLLEIINEYGVLAGILLLLFIIHVSYIGFAKMMNNIKNGSSLYPFLFYLWIFLFLNAMLSGSLNDSRLLIVTACCILINTPLIIKENE